MINAIKKFLTKWFSPYTIFFIDSFGQVSEVHYSWTLKGALEWTACSLREEEVEIFKYHNPIAYRSDILEV